MNHILARGQKIRIGVTGIIKTGWNAKADKSQQGGPHCRI